MTVSEMITAVKYELDQQSSLTSPVWFENEEILFWLNEAQLTFVKQRMFGTNAKQESFEASQKRTDDIRTLIVEEQCNVVVAPYGTEKPNVLYAAIASFETSDAKYLYYLDSRIKLTTAGWVGTERIPYSGHSSFVTTTYNRPYIEKPLVYFYGNNIGVIIDPDDTISGGAGFSNEWILTYVKEPKELVASGATGYQTTTCEIAEQAHNEIVALAVRMILENIESPRIQTNEMELSRKE